MSGLGNRDFKKVQVFQQAQIPETLSRLALWRMVLQTRRGMGDSIEILVNGETQSFKEPLSVAELLARLGLPEKKIAVEHNLEIVPKSAYATHMIEAGDRIRNCSFYRRGLSYVLGR